MQNSDNSVAGHERIIALIFTLIAGYMMLFTGFVSFAGGVSAGTINAIKNYFPSGFSYELDRITDGSISIVDAIIVLVKLNDYGFETEELLGFFGIIAILIIVAVLVAIIKITYSRKGGTLFLLIMSIIQLAFAFYFSNDMNDEFSGAVSSFTDVANGVASFFGSSIDIKAPNIFKVSETLYVAIFLSFLANITWSSAFLSQKKKEPIQQTLDIKTTEPVNKMVSEPISKIVNEPVNKRVNEPINKTIKQPEIKKSNKKFCSKCGNKLTESSLFCGGCGSKLN